MIQNIFQDIKLPALGLGCMRLPTTDGNEENVDIPAVKEMVKYALDNGVNYFDTAWMYHRHTSETVMGEVLSEYPRESYFLASKFPGFSLESMNKIDEIFSEQLKKCRTDYFDFYLFHSVSDSNIDWYLDEKYGLLNYLLEKKQQGIIRHLGFSAHSTPEKMERFLKQYGRYMEFCQIQLNYLDRTLQNAEEKVNLLKSYSIPVWVMEPLRGGSLCSLSEENINKLSSVSPEMTPAEWGFRYISGIKEVCVTLSGMSNLSQLKENIRIFSVDRKLTDKEKLALFSVADSIIGGETVHCTGCRYCTAYCPQGLNIPELIRILNVDKYSEDGAVAPGKLASLPDSQKPTACIKCHACEEVCPQGIKIPDVLRELAERHG